VENIIFGNHNVMETQNCQIHVKLQQAKGNATNLMKQVFCQKKEMNFFFVSS